MAARDGTGSGVFTAAGATSLVITFSTTASRHLVIAGARNSGTISSITDSGGGSWTVKDKIALNGTGGNAAFVAYSENRAAITSATINYSTSVFSKVALDQYTGVKTSGSFDSQVTADGAASTNAWSSGNLSPSVANCLIVGAASGEDSTNSTWTAPGGSWTEIFQFGDTTANTATETIYQAASGIGPFSCTFTYNGMVSGTYAGASVLVAFAPEPGSAPINTYQTARNPDVGAEQTGFDVLDWFGFKVPSQDFVKWFDPWFDPAAAGGTSAALTGVSATGQVGAVVSNISDPLTGVQGTGAAGTAKSNADYAVSGNQASSAVGNVTANLADALSGASATGNPGQSTPNITYSLTGVEATGQVGTVTAGTGTDIAITGVQAAGQVGTVSPSLSYALSGNQAAASPGNVTANLSQAISGASATGGAGLNTPNITYSLSGVEATGQVGSVSILGGDVTIALTGVEATGQVGNLTASGGDVSSQATGGWPTYLPRRRKRIEPEKQPEPVTAEQLLANAEQARIRLEQRRQLRLAELRSAELTEQIRAIYNEQDMMTQELVAAQQEIDDDAAVAMLIALAS